MRRRTETGYGFFCGGDPREFEPDVESCLDHEIANHKAACALWDEAEARGETPKPQPCPVGWVFDKSGNALTHILHAPYGIGAYKYDVDDI